MIRLPYPVIGTAVAFSALLFTSVWTDDLAGGEVVPSTRKNSSSPQPSTPAQINYPQGHSAKIPEKDTSRARKQPVPSSAGPAPEATRKAPSETPEPSSSAPERSTLRKGLDKVVPGVEDLPDWALPIVARGQEHAAPGTTVKAHINASGKLVVSGQVEIKDELGIAGLRLITFGDGDTKVVEITAIVEDPTEASVENPALVEVTVTNPETEETVTGSAEITSPEEAADVTEQVSSDVVESSRADDILSEEVI